MRKETRSHHIGYSYRLTARVLLYAPSHRQDSTYHGLCYTSRGALAHSGLDATIQQSLDSIGYDSRREPPGTVRVQDNDTTTTSPYCLPPSWWSNAASYQDCTKLFRVDSGRRRRLWVSPSSLCWTACSPTLCWICPDWSNECRLWAGRCRHWRSQRWRDVLSESSQLGF